MTHDHPNSPRRLREKIALALPKKAPPAAVVRPEEPTPTLRVEPAPTAKPPAATLRHRCGHERPLHDVMNADCPACRDQRRKDKARKKREADERRRAAQAAAGAPVLGKLDTSGRLPDGSSFVVAYDAGRVMWTGFLSVPGRGDFTGEGPGVEGLLRELARRFREGAGTEPTQGETHAQG